MDNNIENNSPVETGSENQVVENLPKLYSKRLILVFSGLFSVLFGTVILLSNLKKSGEKKGMIQVGIFALIYVTGMVITIQTMNANTNLALPMNIAGALILNEYFWNRYIGKETEYEKKSWIKPAIISMCISVPAFLALVYLT
ncbi:hypothetical protein [Christiangramia echinicola]|uniref:Uncharacterized protein n=1 Tax=Christiangramia echinicola TaxID=279359 RepID=A0A1H1MJZ8_9FLAO|nr:hypothetical protein [Christiangramia echinicola]SDR86289.1 hypothetical protein SAMN04488552_1311 [Christiangramia echinicola]